MCVVLVDTTDARQIRQRIIECFEVIILPVLPVAFVHHSSGSWLE